MRAILLFLLSLWALSLQAQDTVTVRIQFGCNSSQISTVEERNLLIISGNEIISIEGYASIEGSSEGNSALSTNRALAVSGLLNSHLAVGRGATKQFGNKRGANRVVVVTYVTATKTTSTINAEGIVVETPAPSNHPEGFTCNQQVDPSIYFADTLSESIAVDTAAIEIPEPIVLEVVTPVLTPNSLTAAIEVSPVAVDTLFLPTRQAVRFQMREHGMSREQAIKSIEARKPQWKELKPSKAKAPKKAKAKKVRMKKTRGACRRGLIVLFPTIGC